MRRLGVLFLLLSSVSFGVGFDCRDFIAGLEASWNKLGPDERLGLIYLGACAPAPSTFSGSQLAALAGISVEEANQIAKNLAAAGFIKRVEVDETFNDDRFTISSDVINFLSTKYDEE